VTDRPLVLIIEDNPRNLKLARDVLNHAGYETLEAESAEDGLVLARDRHPGLVLMDVQLPGMDGFAVAEVLAAEPSAPAVVLISSRGRGTFRNRLATASAKGFITKSEFSGECLSLVLT
jgi:CheY-like chemotaxis protein